jgi:hypothetical protein
MIAMAQAIRLGSLSLIVALSLAAAKDCCAQVARYQPRSPTTSPYLNLTRFSGGGINNYYALVRPLNNQRAFNQQEQALRIEQGRKLVRLQNEVTRGLEPNSITGTGSWFQTPESNQKFLNTRQFYPEPPFRGIRR